MSVKLVQSISHVLRVMIGVLCLSCITPVLANECLNLLPYDAVADGLPKLCHSAISGKRDLYSCQDYRSGKNHYRVLYRGGRVPKAVIALQQDDREVRLTSADQAGRKLSCPLTAPAGVPRYASHRGLGICSDERDQPVACSFFSYAAARDSVVHSYMVFYPRNDQEKLHVEVTNTGRNENAMVAELAYQIGRSLSDTDCCSAQALKYLAYAHRLFPRSETYRHAYQRTRVNIALNALQEKSSYNAR